MILALCAIAFAVLAHGWLTTSLPVKDSPALLIGLLLSAATLILTLAARFTP